MRLRETFSRKADTTLIAISRDEVHATAGAIGRDIADVPIGYRQLRADAA
jgi:hypothetical protein